MNPQHANLLDTPNAQDNAQYSQPTSRPIGIQQTTTTFSIATPTVTNSLPLNENLNDSPFIQPAASYQQESIIRDTYQDASKEESLVANVVNNNKTDSAEDVAPVNINEGFTHQKETDLNQTTSDASSVNKSQDDESKIQKKRNKAVKKSIKLDAKSKLEKSRQSARECRARKKLRYQYLEDLVCNREKAVVKLRDELSIVSFHRQELQNIH